MPARDKQLDASHLPHAALIANDENGRLHFVPHFIPSNIYGPEFKFRPVASDGFDRKAESSGSWSETPDWDFPRNIHKKHSAQRPSVRYSFIRVLLLSAKFKWIVVLF